MVTARTLNLQKCKEIKRKMNKEYFLIVRRRHELKDNFNVIDKFTCKGIREAEKEFLNRNKKGNNEEFIILKSERWIQ